MFSGDGERVHWERRLKLSAASGFVVKKKVKARQSQERF